MNPEGLNSKDIGGITFLTPSPCFSSLDGIRVTSLLKSGGRAARTSCRHDKQVPRQIQKIRWDRTVYYYTIIEHEEIDQKKKIQDHNGFETLFRSFNADTSLKVRVLMTSGVGGGANRRTRAGFSSPDVVSDALLVGGATNAGSGTSWEPIVL